MNREYHLIPADSFGEPPPELRTVPAPSEAQPPAHAWLESLVDGIARALAMLPAPYWIDFEDDLDLEAYLALWPLEW